MANRPTDLGRGVVGAYGWGWVMGWDILDWLADHVFSWVILAAVGLAAIAIPVLVYAAYEDGKSPVMELRKSDWACTQSERVPITTYVQSGKVMIPITTYDDRCNQWSRRQ